MNVAKEILRQLGGNRFAVMTGAKNFVGGENLLTFRLRGGTKNKINAVRIELNGRDLYDIKYMRVWGTKVTIVTEQNDVYNDMLEECFTEATGLYTRF